MTLNAFPVDAKGDLGEKRVLVDFGDQTGIYFCILNSFNMLIP